MKIASDMEKTRRPKDVSFWDDASFIPQDIICIQGYSFRIARKHAIGPFPTGGRGRKDGNAGNYHPESFLVWRKLI
jgi:hypothetical protein